MVGFVPEGVRKGLGRVGVGDRVAGPVQGCVELSQCEGGFRLLEEGQADGA
jgi:hypothetical protein